MTIHARQADAKAAVENTDDRSGPVAEVSSLPPVAATAPLTPAEIRTMIGSLAVTMFLAALDQTIVATALPTIGQQFHDVSNLSWVISAYLLASTAMAPVFGTLSDIYGRRAMIILSLSLFLAGSILCAVAPNLSVLILARGLQGIGGGGIVPLVQTTVSDLVSPRERGRYQSYFSAVWVTAAVGGPVLGGIFAEHLHWSMIFWINLPLGLAALTMLLPKMRRMPTYHRPRKVDWVGGMLLMASVVVLMLVLTWGGTRLPWLSPTIASMIGAALLLAATFVWHAKRVEEPFLPLPLMGGRIVPFAMLTVGCGSGALVGLTVLLPLYYGPVYHLSASEAGIGLIPLVAATVPGASLAGWWMAHMKHYKRIAILGTTSAAGAGLFLVIISPLPLWFLVTILSVQGLGLGTIFPVSVVSIQNSVARSQIGTATGALNFSRALFGSLSVTAFTTILMMALGVQIAIDETQRGMITSIPASDMAAAFRYVFAAATVLLAMASLSLFLMEERPLAGPVAKPAELME